MAEYPGVHAQPPQPSEEEESLSHCPDDDASVMGPGQVLLTLLTRDGTRTGPPDAAD